MNPLFRFFVDLENFVFPPLCPICGDELKKNKIICQRCFDKTYFVSSNRCTFCGRPLKSGNICEGCKEEPPSFDFVVSCGSYVSPLADIIKIYKYKNRPSLSVKLARKLYSNYKARSKLTDINLVTWVPMRKAEIRERGYNQSKLLAEEFCRLSSLEGVNLLSKVVNVPSQTKLSNKKRVENVKGTYQVRKKVLKKLNTDKGNFNKKIILIDDVLTTGSTLKECALKLKEAGFKKVVGFVLAISP